MQKFIFILLASAFLFSCEGKKATPAFYDSGDTELTSYEDSSNESADNDFVSHKSNDEIVVPFREEGGVKYVNVSVNGYKFEMIFDTGCSLTLISIAEAELLYKKGLLSQDDYQGNVNSTIADGSIQENMVFNLKEVVIDGKIICTNVTATVSSNNMAPLLLGNEVLNRVASYTIDNENKTINFKLK